MREIHHWYIWLYIYSVHAYVNGKNINDDGDIEYNDHDAFKDDDGNGGDDNDDDYHDHFAKDKKTKKGNKKENNVGRLKKPTRVRYSNKRKPEWFSL